MFNEFKGRTDYLSENLNKTIITEMNTFERINNRSDEAKDQIGDLEYAHSEQQKEKKRI